MNDKLSKKLEHSILCAEDEKCEHIKTLVKGEIIASKSSEHDELVVILKQLSDLYRNSDDHNGFSAYDEINNLGICMVPVEDKEMWQLFFNAGKKAIDDLGVDA